MLHFAPVKSIVVLISGRGSNLKSLIDAARERAWPARITAVLSSSNQALGRQHAEAAGIPYEAIDYRQSGDRARFNESLARALEGHHPDLVVLAGFMRILPPDIIGRYQGRMINIHPSLLPAFPGLDTHQRALAAGVRVHGASVHFVTDELDGGPLIAQAVVPVKDGDDEAALAARVLEQEHRLLPRVVEWIIAGRLCLEAGRVVTDVPAEERVLCAGFGGGDS